ncbi:hypothetical protein MCOR11_006915 [Pyricularia oryzae]|nr:hypothetical protein MCOR11_006915 [Pyricularia oryzae]
MPADVSALVAQMNETLAEIHATVAALNDSDHDAKLDALEQERDAAVQALQAAFEREAEELVNRRRAEDEEIAEKRRLEDEEIAARRRREDEERAEAKARADEEMKTKLEADAREVEEQADGKMDEVEAEAQRMIEDGERRLAELEEKRKEINRMIDEQMRAPLPTAPARPRRARGDRNSRMIPVAAAGAGAGVAAAAAAAGVAAVNSKPSAPETEEAAQSSDNNDVKAPETTEAARGLDVQDAKAADDTPEVAAPEVAKDKEVAVEEAKAEEDETTETKAVLEPVEEAQQETKTLVTESIQAKAVDESEGDVIEAKDLDAAATEEPVATESIQAKNVSELEEEVLQPRDLDAEATKESLVTESIQAKHLVEPEEEVLEPKDLDAQVTKEPHVDNLSAVPTAEDHASSTTGTSTDTSSRAVSVGTAGTSVLSEEEEEIHPVDVTAGKADKQAENDASEQPRETEASGTEKKSFFGSWGSKMKSLVAREQQQQANKSEADTGNVQGSRDMTIPADAEIVPKDVTLGEQVTAEPSVSTVNLVQEEEEEEEEAVFVIKNLDEEAVVNKVEVSETPVADEPQVPETTVSVKQVDEESAKPSAEIHQDVEMTAKIAETELMQSEIATEPAVEHLDGATLAVKTVEDEEVQDLKEEIVIRDLDADYKESELPKEIHGGAAIPKPEETVLAATSDTHVSDKGQDSDIVEPGTAKSEVDTSPHEITDGKDDAKVETKDADSNSDELESSAPDASRSKADEPAAKPGLDDDKTPDTAHDDDDHDKYDNEVTKPTASEETQSADAVSTHADDLEDRPEAVGSQIVPTPVRPNEQVDEPESSEPEPITADAASVQASNVPAEEAHGPNGEHVVAAQTAPTSQGFPAPQDATNHASERPSGLDVDGTSGAESESEAKAATMIALKDSSDVLKAAEENVSTHGDSDLAEEAKNMTISSQSPVATPVEDQLVVDDKMKAEEFNLGPALAANEVVTVSETSLLEDDKMAVQNVESKSTIDKLEDVAHEDQVSEKVEEDKIVPVEEPAAISTEASASTAPATSPASEENIDDEKPSSASANLQAELSAAEDKEESVPDLDEDTTLRSDNSAEESMLLQDHMSENHVAPQVANGSGPDDFSISEFQEPMLDDFAPVSKSLADDVTSDSARPRTPSSEGSTSPRTNQPPSPPTFPATEPSRARRMSNAAIPGAMSSGPANTTQTVEVRSRPESERFSPFTPIPGTMSSGVANTTQTVTVSSRPISSHLSPSTPIPGTMSTGSSSPSFGRVPTPMSATRPALQIPSQLDSAPRGAMLDYIANDPTPVGGPQTFVLGPTPTTPIGDRRGRAKHSRGPSTAAAELITPIEQEPLSAIESEKGGAVEGHPEPTVQETSKETVETAQPEMQNTVSQTPVSPVKPSALGSSLADELSQASLDGQGGMLGTDDEYTPVDREEHHDDGQDAFRGDDNHSEYDFRGQATPQQQSFRGEEQVHDTAAHDTAAEVVEQQVSDKPDGEKADSAEPSGVGADTGAVDAVLGESLSRPETPVAPVSVAHAAEQEQKPVRAEAEVSAKDEVAADLVDAEKSAPAPTPAPAAAPAAEPALEPASAKEQPAVSAQTHPSYDGSEHAESVSAHEPQAQVEPTAPARPSHDKLSLEPGHYASGEASEDDFVTPMQSTAAASLYSSPVEHAHAVAEGMATVDGAHNLFDDETDEESLARSPVDVAEAQAQNAAAPTSAPLEKTEEAKDALPKEKEVPAVLAPVPDPVDAFEQRILQHSPEYFPQSPVFSLPAESSGAEKSAVEAETESQKSLEAPVNLDVAAARQMTPLLVPTNLADHMHDISPLALRQESPMTPRKGLADSRHAPKETAETPLRYSMAESTPQSSFFELHKEQLSGHENEMPHHEPMSWLQGSEAEHPSFASHSRENSTASAHQQEEHGQSQTPEEQEADPSMYAPRDVTNNPWHSRNDSVPMSMHSQTTLSSAPSSPIHSALARDNREPVIRESWPAVPGQHQEYLAGMGAGASLDYSNRPRNYSQATTDYGRSRNVSEVSNFDPFGPSSQKSSARESFQSSNSGVQNKPLPSAPAAVAANHRNSVGAGSSPGSIFQRMRSVFEKPAAEADGSTEPLSRSRPVSGVFVPVKASPRPAGNLDSAGTIREAGNRNSFVLDAAPKKSPGIASYDLNKGYYYDDPSYGREENENERSSLLGKAA